MGRAPAALPAQEQGAFWGIHQGFWSGAQGYSLRSWNQPSSEHDFRSDTYEPEPGSTRGDCVFEPGINALAPASGRATETVMTWNLIDYYHEIEQTSLRMLDAARSGDWDQVGALEAVCEGLIALVQRFDPDQKLDGLQRAEKARIMQRILRMDAEIRSLLEPHGGAFGFAIDSSGHTLH
jgi:flagellar protein FliT